MKEFDYSDIEAATGGFALENLIGKGSHGCVYRGLFPGGKRVAVKAPSQGLQSLGDASKLDDEIDVLASVRGRHLVNLLGVSRSPAHGGHRLLVMEHMPNGSLHDLLHESPTAEEAEAPAWPWRLRVALQVARAVRTLHEAAPPVIHRDIKSANILFDARWDARLADFSLAVRETCHAQSPPAGTIGYLDPCYTAPGKLGPKNDVFSFGVVLLEIVSRRLAMDATCSTTSIVAWALPLLREGRVLDVCDHRLPLTCAAERAIGRVLDVAARCVSTDEEGRPSMGEVVAELQAVVDQQSPSPRWRLLRSLLSGGIIRPCIGARTGSVRARTKKIVCRDHLAHDECDKDGHGSVKTPCHKVAVARQPGSLARPSSWALGSGGGGAESGCLQERGHGGKETKSSEDPKRERDV